MKILGFNITRDKKQPETEIYSTIDAKVNDIVSQWQFTDDRLTIYEDIDRMAQNDEYVAEALDCLVADILPLKNWYENEYLEVENDDDKVKERILEIFGESQIKSQLRNIIYGFLKHGNRYAEFCLHKNNSFSKIADIPQTWSVYRNVDTHGQLKDGNPAEKKINHCAYDQRTDYGNFIAGFYPWQVIHWRMPPYDKHGYGQPFLQAARHNWLKMQFVEDALRRARLERGYHKLIHKIPVPMNATDEVIKKILEDYIKNISRKQLGSIADSIMTRKSVVNPRDVSTDFYLPVSEQMQGDIKVVDPANPQLQNLVDMEYFLNRLFARLKVPKARLANEQDVRAKATMGEINTAYASTIVAFQIDVLSGIYDLVNRVLFLEGIIDDIDDRLQYKLILPSPFVKDEKTRAEIDRIESFAVANYVKAGVLSRDTARQQYLSMDEKESHEEEEKVLGEKEMFPSMPAFGGLQASSFKPDEEILRALYQLRKEAKYNGKGKPATTHRH